MSSDPRAVVGEPFVRLDVRLLGAVEVILDGQRLRAFDSLRLQRILALIALRGDPQHRSRLAFELWPDSDERQARTNLRKLLHEFRKSLPDVSEFADIDNETVSWKVTGPSQVDALRFRDALAAGDLTLAERLYSGDLLPACYDDWVLVEREKLRSDVQIALTRLAEAAAEREDHEATVSYARRILEFEPTDETAVRMKMEAHLALGDRAAVFRSYHQYAEALKRDLGVPPDDAIEGIYQQLQENNRDGADRLIIATASESPFVGRALEWTAAIKSWNAACAGRAHLLLIAGEPGIGKSRLAMELGRHVRAQGSLVASARAYEAAGRLPWGPVVDLLRTDSLNSYVETLDVVWRNELARLMPELSDSQFPKRGISGDPTERHRLFDAIYRAISAGARPLLLILDDLQWCDGETIELIGYVIRSGQASPILVVGTIRSEELHHGHPLLGLIDALAHEEAVTTLSLDRFDETTTAELAAQLHSDDTIDEGFAARLWTESEGNPLFVIEAVRAGLDIDGNQPALTPTIRSVLNARMGQLTEGARRVAELAAVIGRPFTINLIGSATGLDESELVDEIDELWRRRIIRDQGHTYDFTHDKLRAFALDTISPARRRLLHRSVAGSIIKEHSSFLEAASPQLAAHYDQAGMIDEAIDNYRIAGSRAVAVSALDEAVAMFQRALALLADLPPSPNRDALELDIRIALGSPLVAVEGYGSKASHVLYERALSLCRKLSRPVNPPILRGLGLARLQGCRFNECGEFGQALVDHESGDLVAQTEGRYLLGVSAFWRGDLESAHGFLKGAIEGYHVSHRDAHLASYAQDPKAVCLVRLALVELWSGDPEKASRTAKSAHEIADELGHLMTRAYVVTYAAILAAEADDLPHLSSLLQSAEPLWERLSERYLILVLEALRGWLDVRNGSVDGIERILEAVTRSRQDGETLHLTYVLLLLARARGLIGEFREGRAATREALSWTQDHHQHYLEAELWRVDGELAYSGGELKGAAKSLCQAVEVANSQGAGWLKLRALFAANNRLTDQALRRQLGELLETFPSGHDLPAFQAAKELIADFD